MSAPRGAVADGIARDVVTAATNGDQEIVGSSEIHRMDNVGDTATLTEFLDHRFVERDIATRGRHNIDAGHRTPRLVPIPIRVHRN